jgi:hypothetical protein
MQGQDPDQLTHKAMTEATEPELERFPQAKYHLQPPNFHAMTFSTVAHEKSCSCVGSCTIGPEQTQDHQTPSLRLSHDQSAAEVLSLMSDVIKRRVY